MTWAMVLLLAAPLWAIASEVSKDNSILFGLFGIVCLFGSAILAAFGL